MNFNINYMQLITIIISVVDMWENKNTVLTCNF